MSLIKRIHRWLNATTDEMLEDCMRQYLRDRGWKQVEEIDLHLQHFVGLWAKDKGPFHTLDMAFAMEREWQRRKSNPSLPLGSRNCRHGTPASRYCERCDVEQTGKEIFG